MKRLFLILALCFPCSGSIALVQSNIGGTASTASCTSPSCSVTTGAVGFGAPTTAGNFLVLIAWARTSGTGGAGHAAEAPFAIPTTSGFSWTSFGGTWANGSGFSATEAGGEVIYYIPNAASMSVTTTVTAITTGSGNAMSLRTEFDLYEFSGVAHASVVDASIGTAFTTGTPQGGTLATSQSDLVIVTYSGIAGTNTTAGSGYILGFDATVPVLGQTQYAMNVAPGSIATAFGGGSVQYQGASIAFKPFVAPPPTGVVRHKGYVF